MYTRKDERPYHCRLLRLDLLWMQDSVHCSVHCGLHGRAASGRKLRHVIALAGALEALALVQQPLPSVVEGVRSLQGCVKHSQGVLGNHSGTPATVQDDPPEGGVRPTPALALVPAKAETKSAPATSRVAAPDSTSSRGRASARHHTIASAAATATTATTATTTTTTTTTTTITTAAAATSATTAATNATTATTAATTTAATAIDIRCGSVR